MSGQVIALDRDTWRYRMKDLCEETGLPRQAIHFYIQQELLPPGKKTGRNMAWYSDEHLQRLHLIKKLQHERFLPLKAIKALLDGQEEGFSSKQRTFLSSVKDNLTQSLRSSDERGKTVPASEVLERTGVDAADLERALELGLIGGQRNDAGEILVSQADVWMFEMFGEIRRLGFTDERGFSVEDLAFYEDLISRLFEEEVRLLSSRLSQLPPDIVATMIERVLPIIHAYVAKQHNTKVKDFFANLL